MADTAHQHAQKNIVAFLGDLSERGVTALAVLGRESDGHRFVYRVMQLGRDPDRKPPRFIDVEMPGLPLERLRA
jgi:hypothetical protein